MLTESLLSSEVPLIDNYQSLATDPYKIINTNHQKQMNPNKEKDAPPPSLQSTDDIITKQDTGTHNYNPCTYMHMYTHAYHYI